MKTSNRSEQPMENTTLRRTRNRVEKKQEKGCGSKTSHTRLTADGRADRTRVFRHCQKTTTVGHKNIVWADLWVCNENFAVFSSFFRGSERGSVGKLKTARSFFGNFFTRKRRRYFFRNDVTANTVNIQNLNKNVKMNGALKNAFAAVGF